jgi:hypothetical protein
MLGLQLASLHSGDAFYFFIFIALYILLLLALIFRRGLSRAFSLCRIRPTLLAAISRGFSVDESTIEDEPTREVPVHKPSRPGTPVAGVPVLELSASDSVQKRLFEDEEKYVRKAPTSLSGPPVSKSVVEAVPETSVHAPAREPSELRKSDATAVVLAATSAKMVLASTSATIATIQTIIPVEPSTDQSHSASSSTAPLSAPPSARVSARTVVEPEEAPKVWHGYAAVTDVDEEEAADDVLVAPTLALPSPSESESARSESELSDLADSELQREIARLVAEEEAEELTARLEAAYVQADLPTSLLGHVAEYLSSKPFYTSAVTPSPLYLYDALLYAIPIAQRDRERQKVEMQRNGAEESKITALTKLNNQWNEALHQVIEKRSGQSRRGNYVHSLRTRPDDSHRSLISIWSCFRWLCLALGYLNITRRTIGSKEKSMIDKAMTKSVATTATGPRSAIRGEEYADFTSSLLFVCLRSSDSLHSTSVGSPPSSSSKLSPVCAR